MEFFEAHRQRMVDHFVWLFQIDPEYARHAASVYQKTPSCPFPKIGHDVKEKIAELSLGSNQETTS